MPRPTSSRSCTHRNSACPCGSGKKFKHCCKTLEKPTTYTAFHFVWVAVVSIGIGYWAYVYSDWQTGIAFGTAVATIIGMVFIWRDPPPPNDKYGDGGPPGTLLGGLIIF